MQLSLETDYTVRCVLYLAQADQSRSVQEVSRAMRMEKDTARKLLDRLHDAGIVKVNQEVDGNYALAMNPDKIMVTDVLCVSEDTIKINRCLEHDGYCNRNATCDCPMHKFYNGIQGMLEQVFDNTSIMDIMEGKAEPYARLM